MASVSSNRAVQQHRRHSEFCEYGDCEAYATGGIRLNLCQYHSDIALEDALTMSLFPHVEADRRKRDAGVGTVYAIKFSDRIKIGFSTDVPRRLKQLPHDEILALRDGCTMRDERAYHAILEPHKITGEWFADVSRCAGCRRSDPRCINFWLPQRNAEPVTAHQQVRLAGRSHASDISGHRLNHHVALVVRVGATTTSHRSAPATT